MSITITLENTLAEQLRAKASARQLSLEEFAVRLLGDAVTQLDVSEQWEAQNQRRLALIRKSFTSPLTAEEATELQELQTRADQRLEPGDQELLSKLRQMRQAVEDLPEPADA